LTFWRYTYQIIIITIIIRVGGSGKEGVGYFRGAKEWAGDVEKVDVFKECN